jgi:hypothetical protein
VEDFDVDGYPDFAAASSHSEDPGQVLVFRGIGDGRFEFVELRIPGDYPVSIVAGDFDRDGLVDLALPCIRYGTIGVLYNVSTTPQKRQVATTVESAEIIENTAHVTWTAPGITRVRAERAERAERGMQWMPFGTPVWLPSGALHIEDASIERGDRFGYRLVSLEPGVEIIGSEVWVKAMPRGGIRVHEAAVASAGGVMLAVEVEEAGHADIDVFDSGGRRVATARAVVLRPGENRLALPGSAGIGPGVYWARVVRGEQRSVARVVVLE